MASFQLKVGEQKTVGYGFMKPSVWIVYAGLSSNKIFSIGYAVGTMLSCNLFFSTDATEITIGLVKLKVYEVTAEKIVLETVE